MAVIIFPLHSAGDLLHSARIQLLGKGAPECAFAAAFLF
jgi:hypothetical protein